MNGSARRGLLLGAAASFAVLLVVVAAVLALGSRSDLPWLLPVLALAPAAAALSPDSLLRRHFPQLHLAASVATGATAAVLLGLVASVLVLGRSVREDEAALLWAGAVGLLAAAVAAPLLTAYAARLARSSGRGARRTPEQVLRLLSEQESDAPAEDLLQQLVDALRRAYALDLAEVWTGDGQVLLRSAASPAAAAGVASLSGPELVALARADVAGESWLRLWLPRLLEGREDAQVRVSPARHAGNVLGLLLVGRGPGSPRFSEADERALTDLSRRLGVLLSNRALDDALRATLEDLRGANSDLRKSRARLASAADAERRRIERDLHDGAQQHLVALAVTLGLAKDLVRDDPDAAVELLAESVTEVKATVQQVRDLAHGIYPPLLAESGVAAALTSLVGRSGQPVAVRAESFGRHAAPVEEAVYFCCLEALQNAAKHAPGATTTVLLRTSADSVEFEVVDDGPGFDPSTVAAGHGFANIADRLGAIGGRVTWTSRPGEGVRALGVVPLPVRVEG